MVIPGWARKELLKRGSKVPTTREQMTRIPRNRNMTPVSAATISGETIAQPQNAVRQKMPMAEHQTIGNGRGQPALEFTGYGEDGILQPQNPTGIVNTDQGQQPNHEGELQIKGPDGRMTVVPAHMLPQDVLSMIAKRSGNRGYAEGTPDIKDQTQQAPIVQSSTFVPNSTIQSPVPMESTLGAPKTSFDAQAARDRAAAAAGQVITPAGTSDNNPLSPTPQQQKQIDASVKQTIDEAITGGAPTSIQPVSVVKDQVTAVGSDNLSVPSSTIQGPVKSSIPMESTLGAPKTSFDADAARLRAAQATGAAPPWATGAPGAQMTTAEVDAARLRSAQAAGTAPAFATGTPGATMTREQVAAAQARARAVAQKPPLSTIQPQQKGKSVAAPVVAPPWATGTPGAQMTAEQAQAAKDRAIAAEARKRGIAAAGKTVQSPSGTTIQTPPKAYGDLVSQEALQYLRDIMNGTSQTDRNILNAYFQQFDLSSAAQMKALQQQIASNPNLSDEARASMIAGMSRAISSSRAQMAGTEALAMQQRAQQAATSVWNMGRELVTYGDERQEAAYSKALAAGDYKGAAAIYKEMTGKDLDTSTYESDKTSRMYVQIGSLVEQGVPDAEILAQFKGQGLTQEALNGLKATAMMNKTAQTYQNIGLDIDNNMSDADILAKYKSFGLTQTALTGIRADRANQVSIDTQLGLYVNKTPADAIGDQVLQRAYRQKYPDWTQEMINNQITLELQDRQAKATGTVDTSARIAGLFTAKEGLTDILGDVVLRNSIRKQLQGADALAGLDEDGINSAIDAEIRLEWTKHLADNKDDFGVSATEAITSLKAINPTATLADAQADPDIFKYVAAQNGWDPYDTSAGNVKRINDKIESLWTTGKRTVGENAWQSMIDSGAIPDEYQDLPPDFSKTVMNVLLAPGGGFTYDSATGTITSTGATSELPWNNPRYFDRFINWDSQDINWASGSNPNSAGYLDTVVSTVDTTGKDPDTGNPLYRAGTGANGAVTYGDMKTEWAKVLADATSNLYLSTGSDGQTVFDTKKFLHDRFAPTEDKDGNLINGGLTYQAFTDGLVAGTITTDFGFVSAMFGDPINDPNNPLVGKSVYDPKYDQSDTHTGVFVDATTGLSKPIESTDPNMLKYLYWQFDQKFGSGAGKSPLGKDAFDVLVSSGKWALSDTGQVMNFDSTWQASHTVDPANNFTLLGDVRNMGFENDPVFNSLSSAFTTPVNGKFSSISSMLNVVNQGNAHASINWSSTQATILDRNIGNYFTFNGRTFRLDGRSSDADSSNGRPRLIVTEYNTDGDLIATGQLIVNPDDWGKSAKQNTTNSTLGYKQFNITYSPDAAYNTATSGFVLGYGQGTTGAPAGSGGATFNLSNVDLGLTNMSPNIV